MRKIIQPHFLVFLFSHVFMYVYVIVVFKFYDFDKTVRKTGCAVRGFWVIIERFSRRRPRKSRDNHSKTSNRASCVPNSFPEKAQNLKCAFSWTLFSFTSEQIFHCSEENNANPRKNTFSSFWAKLLHWCE